MALLQEECFLLELLSELGEFLSHVRNLLLKAGCVVAKCGDFLLQVSNPFSFGDLEEWDAKSIAEPQLPPRSAEGERIAHLEKEVAALRNDAARFQKEIADVRQEFAQFRKQFE